MKINYTLLAIAILFSINSRAQDSTYFTLSESKNYALEHHLDIQNAYFNIENAQQQIVETRGMGLPQIDLSGQFNHFINIPVSVVDATLFNPTAQPGEVMEFRMGTEFSTTGTLQANQLLFNGSYIVGLQVSKYFKDFQESAAMSTKEDVVFNVIQAYQLASIAKESLEFADSMVVLTQNIVDKQQHFLELGLMMQEDMDQLSYSLLITKNAQIATEIQYQNALTLLKLSMGYPMDEEIEITETTDVLMMESALRTGDINSNLQLELMAKKVKLSSYNVKNNKFANLPSLYAFFSHSYNAYLSEFNFFEDEKWYPQTVWGLQLQVPVFSGLQRHARTQQAKISLLKDQNTLEQLERVLVSQEIQIKNNIKGAQDKLELQKQNVELAQRIYNNAITKENIGKGNSITVTQKQNQLMMAHSQYLGALMELLQAQLNLDKLHNNILQNK
tara:strand:+ start:52636 stop:53973 length:1338 start_codon:yes stop_codon:yes gene_type:complete